MKIAFFELEKWEQNYVKRKLGKKALFFEENLNEENVEKVKDVEILGIFIYSLINKKILSKMKKLKFINTFSTGYDHIDLEECRKRKILVSNVPSYSEDSVAEHTFGLILTIAKKLYESISRVKQNDFSLNNLLGFELKNKVLGIVGTGKIGSKVAKIAKGFEMKVLAYSRSKKEELERIGVRYVSYEELLRKSDIITFHLPLNKETYHFFNKKHLEMVKKGVIIINTARGPIIETEALLEGLEKGKISAVGLDVFEGECDIKEEKELTSKIFLEKCDLKKVLESFILKEKQNAYVTPHSAWYTKESLKRLLDIGIENIKAFLRKKPQNLI